MAEEVRFSRSDDQQFIARQRLREAVEAAREEEARLQALEAAIERGQERVLLGIVSIQYDPDVISHSVAVIGPIRAMRLRELLESGQRLIATAVVLEPGREIRLRHCLPPDDRMTPKFS
jgi:hypothetical protein